MFVLLKQFELPLVIYGLSVEACGSRNALIPVGRRTKPSHPRSRRRSQSPYVRRKRENLQFLRVRSQRALILKGLIIVRSRTAFGYFQKKVLCQLCMKYHCSKCCIPRIPLQVINETPKAITSNAAAPPQVLRNIPVRIL